MYAIVNIAGQQFKVSENQNLYVHRLANDEGSSVEFNNVLFVDNDGKITENGDYQNRSKYISKNNR